MAARRPPPLAPAAIERWCQHVQGEVSHVVEATGFVNFELQYHAEQKRCVISPTHYIITFANHSDKGRPRCHSSLLTIRTVPEESLPDEVQVGVEIRGRDGESVVCAGEYVEFELFSQAGDAAKQPPLRIASGPARVNPQTQQREFMRIDLGRCVRQIVTDTIDDPRHKGQKLARSRWWICLEILRLVCKANSLDCSALDTPGAQPLEWVICLTDESSQPKAADEASTPQDEKSIDELAKFIDGGSGKKAKAKKKKKGLDSDGAAKDDAQGVTMKESASSRLAAPAPAAPPCVANGGSPPLRTVGEARKPPAESAMPTAPQPVLARTPQEAAEAAAAAAASAADGRSACRPRQRPGPLTRPALLEGLAPALVDIWQDLAGGDVRHIAEAGGFVHMVLSFCREKLRRVLTPEHYIVAFPQLSPGLLPRYHSALLTMRLVDGEVDGSPEEDIEFTLLARLGEAPATTPLRFSAGPVRVNEKTGQRESMRLELGECVRWATPDLVDGIVSGDGARLVRQRWRVSVETLRLVCKANSLDLSGLDFPGRGPPLEWVVCLMDERIPVNGGGYAPDLCPPERPASAVAPGQPAPDPDPAVAAAPKPKSKKKNKAGKDPDAKPPCSMSSALAAQLAQPRAFVPLARDAGEQNRQPAAGPGEPTRQAAAVAARAPAAAQAPLEVASPLSPPAVPSRSSDYRGDDGAEESGSSQAKEQVRKPHQLSSKAPPASRTLALPSASIDSWCQFARRQITHIAEATGFVHFQLSFDAARGCRTVSPEHYIVAFASRDKGKPRHHSSLLSLRVVGEDEVPKENLATHQFEAMPKNGKVEYVEFELLLRAGEGPLLEQLRVTAGPVRTNPDTGQRESMRIDLGRCVRQIVADVVDDPRGKRVARSRWWICVETLRLVCAANSLDCAALDEPEKPPLEWVTCLVDERSRAGEEVLQQGGAEDRNIDDLVDFISGKGNASKKKKKKKEGHSLQELSQFDDDLPSAVEDLGLPAARLLAGRPYAFEVPEPQPLAGDEELASRALSSLAGLEPLLSSLRSEFAQAGAPERPSMAKP